MSITKEHHDWALAVLHGQYSQGDDREDLVTFRHVDLESFLAEIRQRIEPQPGPCIDLPACLRNPEQEYEARLHADDARAATPCIGGNPSCPCQDGDICHYRDSADGTKGWPIPAPADAVEVLRELVAYVDEPAGFNAACAADTDSFVAFMDAIEQKRKAIVERARAALAAADQKEPSNGN